MMFTQNCNKIFSTAVRNYHLTDNVDTPISNPYPTGSIENLLYQKNWIDTVQWHLEDIIRDPHIDPADALLIKRRIDSSNQERTDIVEQIDTYFLNLYSNIVPEADAKINTESPAWAIDRLSILHVKIWHMREQTERTDISAEQKQRCIAKLSILQEQLTDLTLSISQLLEDYAAGRRIMKVYRQMKMYNDPQLNPVLYNKK
ncbi:MAG: DUF4254 domain-containing protein [Paludibacteraceae bacterium]|nr:DUF4254 domain-containing protein [Paludibacteraceae bacterium]